MKLALVVPGFSADETDWAIPALAHLARALAARPGIELHIYTLRYPHRPGSYRFHGAAVHALGGAPLGGRRVRGLSLGLLWTSFLAAIRREHRRAPFTLLHGFWATESGYLAALAGRLLGIPAFVHLAGGELTYDPASGYGNRRPGLARLLVALSLRLATRITVPSTPMRRQLARTYPRHAAKAHPWSFGLDLTLFSPNEGAGSPTRENRELKTQNSKLKTRLIHAASLVPVKDQAWLLDGLAAARAMAPQVALELTIAGAGPELRALQARAARPDLAGTVTFARALPHLELGAQPPTLNPQPPVVTFAGAVPHLELPALYRAHDAFVLTSRHEAQCLAVLEAAACGRPWIGPPVGALTDLAARQPASGWLVAERTPAALGRAILAATDPEVRAARGTAARTQVADHYALERQTDRLLALYRSVGR